MARSASATSEPAIDAWHQSQKHHKHNIMNSHLHTALTRVTRATLASLITLLPALSIAQVTYVDRVPTVDELQAALQQHRGSGTAGQAQAQQPQPEAAAQPAQNLSRQIIWNKPAAPAVADGSTNAAVPAAQPAPAPRPANTMSAGPAVAMPITFDTNSSRVAGSSVAYVDAVAGLLQRDPSLRLTIEGHTDAVGSPQRNLPLSWERAMSVFRLLIERHGIDPQRLQPIGRGSLEPLDGLPPTAPRNRRVQFRVLG
jgi:outer membrane protein OmpA-like peptidoglycan-associated protein